MELSEFVPSNLLHTQESPLRYRPGGYHPVTIGDTFHNGRYTVHHKLGYGGYSTVWLAKDEDQNQWIGLKIMTADSSKSQELRILNYLEQQSRDHLSSNYIVQLLDEFTHEGPNGAHQCLVLELLGPSVDQVLRDYYEGGDVLDAEIIIRLSEQLLKAVRFMHSAGICHGDISARNVAFTSRNLWYKTEEDILSVIGPPEIEKLSRRDGMPLADGLPSQLVKAAGWIDWIDEDEEDIRIIDLGESFFGGQEPEKLAQPGPLKVPETIFTDELDYRVDLWRTRCMIYSFIFRTQPFWTMGEEEALIFQMIGFVEKLPAEWEPQWNSMAKKSRHDLKIEEDDGTSKLERKFTELAPDASLEPLLRVIQGMMRFLPSSRLSAGDALEMLEKSWTEYFAQENFEEESIAHSREMINDQTPSITGRTDG